MELWHVLNRGVDGRDLFMDTQDLARFVHDLYEFNDSSPAENIGRDFNMKDLRDRDPSFKQKRLVDIHGWVLMKNHYHLLLSERVEGGLSLFMRKVNTGFANYFNARHERKGTLFQGRTKKILIKRHAHFLYILHYIHLNPLDYLKGAQNWRIRSKGNIEKTKEALEYLDTYRWSSYSDYSGQKNFPSILTTVLFKKTFGDYKAALAEYLKDSADDGSEIDPSRLE